MSRLLYAKDHMPRFTASIFSSSQMIYVGIDPGEKGAIAYLNEDGSIKGYKYFRELEVKELLKFFTYNSDDLRVVLEKLWGMPIRGCMGNWSLGGNFKCWQLMLELAGVSSIEVPPQTWQKHVLNTSKKKSADTKPLSLAYVNKRYPELNLPCKRKTDIDQYSGVSDAICMALYSRYLHLNKL